jgi:hypothetical protein
MRALALFALGSLACGCALLWALRAPRIDRCGDGPLAPPEAFPAGPPLRARYRAESPRVTVGLELWAERRGEELLLLGIGPLGAKAFVVRQRGGQVTVERPHGPAAQIEPENVLRDLYAFAEGGGGARLLRRAGCGYSAWIVPLDGDAPASPPPGARPG